MSTTIRTFWVCDVCGKSRIEVIGSVVPDGWWLGTPAFRSENSKAVCPNCLLNLKGLIDEAGNTLFVLVAECARQRHHVLLQSNLKKLRDKIMLTIVDSAISHSRYFEKNDGIIAVAEIKGVPTPQTSQTKED